MADEAKATVDGDLDKGLRQEIQRAVGTSKTRPDSSFDARQRASDAVGDAIAVLRSEGYYGYDVEPDVADGEPPQPVIHVQTGPRFLIQAPELDWVGTPPEPAAAKAGLDAVKLTPGAPGRAADVVAAEGRVVAAVEKLGYADAVAQPRVVVADHADHSLRPTFKIAAGDLVRLGGVTVITDGRTNPLWVRGLAPWKHGDVYSPKAVAELERRLTDVGVYDQVTVSMAPKDKAVDGFRPVIVSLADRPPHTLELGAGFSTTGGTTVYTNYQEGGAGDLSIVGGSGVDGKLIWYNRLHRADTLTLSAKIYDIQQKLDLELDLPHWRRPGQTLKIGVALFGDKTDAFDDYGGGARVDIERRYSRASYVTLGASADYVTTTEKTAVNSQALPVGEKLKLFIPSLLAAFAVDRSNDLLNPTHGWRFDLRAEPTVVTGDRQLTYLKIQGEASAYLPLGRDDGTVLAGRVHVGSIVGGRIPDVPTDRRFFAGGGGSVRGYGYQAVGPRLSDNTPEGGLSLVETSFELRQKVTGRWGVVGFIDAGSVGSTSAPDFKHMRAGVGVGVRYDLGFGPIRLDIATPLARRQGDAPFQLYISIGQSF